MVDVVPAEVRSRMMAGIRGKDTKPELIIRRSLHAAGFRYRVHDKALPGKPDMVFPRRKAVIFVHGCFWHGHNCHLFRLPSTRKDFWQSKIHGNIERDTRAIEALRKEGWRTGVVWECALKGRSRRPVGDVAALLINWLNGDGCGCEVGGIAE